MPIDEIDYTSLPAHMQHGMKLYVEKGIAPGSFLTAVLCNDLMEACARADDTNLYALPTYARWLYNRVPATCFGSREAFEAWIAKGGLEGRKAA